MTALILFFIGLLLFSTYIFKTASKGGPVAFPLGDRIAVVEINGTLLDSKEILGQIQVLNKNEHVKAVVLRINSPGGGVSPSQDIYSEIIKIKEKKKIVASLSSVAASGGYYIASAADKIVASPGTLTGSIGVIMSFSNVQGLFDKLGLKTNVVKSGKYKDMGSPLREMKEEERIIFQSVIDNVHSQFISAVAQGRGMAVDEVRKIADGRIFSGEQALELGLVDKLGTLQDSIEMAAKMAGIEGEPAVIYTKKKRGLTDFFFGDSLENIIGNLPAPQLMYLMR